MKRTLPVAAAIALLACGDAVFAGPMPGFSVEVGDGVIRFEDVELREHEHAGATLFNAVAVNQTGCDIELAEVDLVFVSGEGDRIKRVGIRNFRNGAHFTIPERPVPVPLQEVTSVHGIPVLGPMVCAKAVAAEKLARENALEAERRRLAEAEEARRQVAAEKAARIAGVRAKSFGTGYAGLALGMTSGDIRTLAEDDAFPWRPTFIGDAGMSLQCKAGLKCDIGCERVDGSGRCAEIERVSIDFSGGKSVAMTFQSPPFPAALLDGALKPWGDCACNELSSRLGKPTEVSKRFLKPGARDFRKGNPAQYVSWARNNATYRISGSTRNGEYRMTVRIEDAPGRPARGKRHPRSR